MERPKALLEGLAMMPGVSHLAPYSTPTAAKAYLCATRKWVLAACPSLALLTATRWWPLTKVRELMMSWMSWPEAWTRPSASRCAVNAFVSCERSAPAWRSTSSPKVSEQKVRLAPARVAMSFAVIGTVDYSRLQ